MKKVLVILLLLFVVTGCQKKEKFYLDDIYYGRTIIGNTNEIDKNKLNELINKKESFGLFIYQPMCSASSDFSKVLDAFKTRNKMSFYEMSFSNMKETSLYEDIKYYPSFVIFKEGQLVAYLDANDKKDTDYYKTVQGFKEWFNKYVILKDVNNTNSMDDYNQEETNNNNQNDNNESQDNNIENNIPENNREDAKLENIKYDSNKINIYFFWGNGCPHCEAEHEFFDSIKTQYGKYYNLHTFEVWYNQDNAALLNEFAEKLNKQVEGVPFTIIGNKVFSGFAEAYKQDMINAIKNQYRNSYDVYFDNE